MQESKNRGFWLSPNSPQRRDLGFPRLVRLLASGQVSVVARRVAAIAREPAAAPIQRALEVASRTIAALDAGTLSSPAEDLIAPELPVRLEEKVEVPPGLRALIGETASLLFEANRLNEAGALFAALASLTPGSAAGGLGLCAVHLLDENVESALSAARWAISVEPTDLSVRSTLDDVLFLAQRKNRFRSNPRKGRLGARKGPSAPDPRDENKAAYRSRDQGNEERPDELL